MPRLGTHSDRELQGRPKRVLLLRPDAARECGPSTTSRAPTAPPSVAWAKRIGKRHVLPVRTRVHALYLGLRCAFGFGTRMARGIPACHKGPEDGAWADLSARGRNRRMRTRDRHGAPSRGAHRDPERGGDPLETAPAVSGLHPAMHRREGAAPFGQAPRRPAQAVHERALWKVGPGHQPSNRVRLPALERPSSLQDSEITSPFFASYVTSLTRATLSELIASVPAHRTVISATTDCLVTDAPPLGNSLRTVRATPFGATAPRNQRA